MFAAENNEACAGANNPANKKNDKCLHDIGPILNSNNDTIIAIMILIMHFELMWLCWWGSSGDRNRKE